MGILGSHRARRKKTKNKRKTKRERRERKEEERKGRLEGLVYSWKIFVLEDFKVTKVSMCFFKPNIVS